MLWNVMWKNNKLQIKYFIIDEHETLGPFVLTIKNLTPFSMFADRCWASLLPSLCPTSGEVIRSPGVSSFGTEGKFNASLGPHGDPSSWSQWKQRQSPIPALSGSQPWTGSEATLFSPERLIMNLINLHKQSWERRTKLEASHSKISNYVTKL